MKSYILNLLQKRWTVPAATAVAGFGVGTFVGYMFTKKQYDKIEIELSQLREDQARVDYVINQRGLEFNKQIQQAAHVARELREQAQEMLNSLKATSAVNEVPEEPEFQEAVGATVHNIFDHVDDEWDYKTEIETRDRNRPYVIHVDEYVGDEMGWNSQSTLTWYERDRVLCDSRDTPIYNPEAIVGELRFGHGSNDPNVVYIRNEALQAEYEILRDTGSYEEIVLGEKIDAEEREQDIKHSMSRKFRSD